ncbi:hypothetical protein H6503_02480 [Candidatus Woesearchaeota archaeon]|nr:hypothetical protein [Candidatus Woesearchaeota archaeon]
MVVDSQDQKDEIASLRAEIEGIKKKEDVLLRKVDLDIHKDSIKKKMIFKKVEKFSFNDFAQITIGVCVFGLPAFINTSFWDYLPSINTDLLIYIHLFFVMCVILALNYEFRDDFTINRWFFQMLLKRFFFTYVSVLMIVMLLLVLVNKMSYDLTNLIVFRNFLAAQSVGMFGAVTFSFLKK